MQDRQGIVPVWVKAMKMTVLTHPIQLKLCVFSYLYFCINIHLKKEMKNAQKLGPAYTEPSGGLPAREDTKAVCRPAKTY